MLVEREWLDKHKNDFTQEDIDSLGIEIIVDERKLGNIRQGDRKGKLKSVLESQRGESKRENAR